MNPSTIYFASDFHLGAPNKKASQAREQRILDWMDSIESEVEELFLVGDIFDFWFEYKHAVPRGYVRLLGKLALWSDRGVKIHFFTGNHDMWTFGYLEEEIGLQLHRKPISIKRQGLKIMVGHGDGLGPGDWSYKFLKNFFDSRMCQWLFARLHPNFGFGLASFLSRKSRAAGAKKETDFHGEQEWLAQYCKQQEKIKHHDLYIFGHRHLPIDMSIGDSSRYVNLGEWINYQTFGRLQNGKLKLEEFKPLPEA